MRKLIAQVVEVFSGKQSRKVAFGVWLFLVSTTLLKAALILPEQWLKCMYLSCALIGFGTVLDDVVATFGKIIANFAADKVKDFIGKESAPEAVPNV